VSPEYIHYYRGQLGHRVLLDQMDCLDQRVHMGQLVLKDPRELREFPANKDLKV